MKIYLWILFCFITSPLVSAQESRPNVLFIVCDDLNSHVSTSGYQPIETPAFEQLAKEGMTFERAYCQYPVCGPSRASFLSGLYPETTTILGNDEDIRELRPGTMSMPEAFKKTGYWTASTGKVFHGFTKYEPGETWDEVVKYNNDEMPHVAKPREEFEKQHGSIHEQANRELWKERLASLSKQTRGQSTPGYGPSGLKDEQHADGKNAQQVISWLDSKSYGDQPFFIACGIQKPHVPFLAPDSYFEKYPQENLKFHLAPKDFWDQAPHSAIDKRYEGFGFELGIENDSLRREYTQAYHACITFIDTQIGKIFAEVKRQGLWENTIIVLTSDHGYQLGEHFMWGKVTLFEVCARVPMIVRVPGMTPAGSKSKGLIELVDLFPTLAELCSVPIPDETQGKSFVPMLADPTAPGKPVAYTMVKRGEERGRAIRTHRYRYALWPDGEELYDLENDPHEYTNLANSTEHRELLEQMRGHLSERYQVASSGMLPDLVFPSDPDPLVRTSNWKLIIPALLFVAVFLFWSRQKNLSKRTETTG